MVALLWGELTAMGDWPSRVHQCRVVIDMPEAHRVPDFVRECVRHGTGAAWSLRAQPHMANTCPDERTTAGPVRIGYKFNRDPTDSIRRQALPAFDADHAHCPSGELMDRRACGVLERSHGGRREPRGLEVETWRLRQPPKRFHTPVQCASDELPVEGQVKARFRDQVHGGLRVLEPQLPCDVSRMAEGEQRGEGRDGLGGGADHGTRHGIGEGGGRGAGLRRRRWAESRRGAATADHQDQVQGWHERAQSHHTEYNDTGAQSEHVQGIDVN